MAGTRKIFCVGWKWNTHGYFEKKAKTMTKLYPIGTILTTRRLSQISLYEELFGEKGIQTAVCLNLGTSWVDGLHLSAYWPDDGYGEGPYDLTDDGWRVTVTPENQAWLSPVPMVGDLVLHGEEPFCPPYARLWEAHLYNEEADFVEKRTYPNGQRAPLIEWDEVQEPL